MKKIIIFGDLPIATKVCEFIAKQKDIDVVGVVIGNPNPKNNDPFPGTPLLQEYAVKNQMPILKMDDLCEIYDKGSIDLGVSCRFSKLIKKETLNLFSTGIVNFHGGLLPECGGLFSSVHSILEGHDIGGGTLHWVDEGIDTGDILARAEFKISDNDTGFTVFQKTQQKLYDAFVELFFEIINGTAKSYPQSSYIKKGYTLNYFNSKSLNGLKQLSVECLSDSLSCKSAIKKIRAFDFPGHEPAYLIICDQKVYLRLTP